MGIFNPTLTEKQSKAYMALNDRSVVEVLFGGAKGGAKSYFLCAWVFLWAVALANRFDLQPTGRPIHLGWMGRKQATDFTATTLQTWQEIIPADEYQIRSATDRHPKHILIQGRVAVDYGGLDRREDISKFNSAEYAFIAVDQAEETTRDDVSILRASRRLKIKGHHVLYKGLWTANPAQCWLKREFILNPSPEVRFIQALPSDNPHLPTSYVNTLKNAFKHRPDMLEAYLHGNWDAFEGAEQVIQEKWIRQAMVGRKDYWPFIKEYIAIDCARFGDDETVILFMENTDIVQKIVMAHCATTEISGKVAVMSIENDNCAIVVESIGSDIGAAVADELRSLDRQVVEFNPSLKPSGKDAKDYGFYSLRCEAWHYASKVLSSGRIGEENINVCISKPDIDEKYGMMGMDETMVEQLCAPRYKWRGGKLVIEPKSETKTRIERSPDHADAYVIALWVWEQMPRKGECAEDFDRPARRAEAYERTAMDM